MGTRSWEKNDEDEDSDRGTNGDRWLLSTAPDAITIGAGLQEAPSLVLFGRAKLVVCVWHGTPPVCLLRKPKQLSSQKLKRLEVMAPPLDH